MADQQPSWLADESGPPAGGNTEPSASAAAPAPEPVPAASITVSDTTASSTTAPAASSTVDESDLPKMIFVMRLANMGLAVAMIACSIVTMISMPTPAVWVLAVYATCGGLLICVLETQLKFLRVMIAMNFGFLFNAVWRFMFYVLMGSVAWAFKNLFGRAMGIAFVAVAFFNTYVLCRYPSYRKMREKIAEEEDKRIEQRISSEVKKKAVGSMLGRK